MAVARKTIVVTGANVGLGFQCCLALAQQDNMHVIVAGRNPQRIDEAVSRIKAHAKNTSTVERGIVDLADLKSVRRFADDLHERKLELFSVVCNGGIQVKAKASTVDGFESTIGTNHIGHFLLTKLLHDITKRVVVVSSEVHDPADFGLFAPPDVSDLDQMARGYPKFDAVQAYATSKLCNLVFAKEHARRFPDGPEVLAFTPGFVPDTTLSRTVHPALFAIVKVFISFYTWLKGGRNSTSVYSGGCMARAASEEPLSKNGWHNGDYIRVDEVYSASAQACDPVLGKALWEKSEEWVKPFTN